MIRRVRGSGGGGVIVGVGPRPVQRRARTVRRRRVLRRYIAIRIAVLLVGGSHRPLATTGARRLQAAAVLARLLLHPRAAKLGLVAAVGAPATVCSPAALASAAAKHAVHLDDGALAY